MRTTIDIDGRLLLQAMRNYGAHTKKATVETELQLLLQIYAQTGIRRLRGKVAWEGDLKQSRNGRVRS